MLSVIIAKPTKRCNADCEYCSSPPDGSSEWQESDLEGLFMALRGNLSEKAVLIWHGGEPMLMGPDFYRKAHELSSEITPQISFSMQTNILLYKSSRWRDVFREIFNGSISTSYDPDEKLRTIKGNSEKYNSVFFEKLEELMMDGFNPMVIGTFTNETSGLMHLMYDKSIARKNPYHIRLNYCSPVGREGGRGLLIDPETYGQRLVEIYDRWAADVPGFRVTPLDQMLGKILGIEGDRCPWTRNCGGSFISIMPNGDVYNCGEFSDVSAEWKYGNIFQNTYSPRGFPINFYRKSDSPQIIPALLSSNPAVQIMRRSVSVPSDCLSCRHYKECQGGCVRDAVLYKRGIGGKFMYCKSWLMVFDHIKKSILSGKSDKLIQWFGCDPSSVRNRLNLLSNSSDINIWSN